MAAAAPCPRSQDYCVYALGGYNGAGLATIEAYDPLGNRWTSSDGAERCDNSTAVACLPAPVELGGSSEGPCPSSPDECIYVTGGSNGTRPASTNEAYDAALNTWVSSDAGGACANAAAIACLPTARYGAGEASAPCPGEVSICLYVVGGATTTSGAPVGTVEAYQLHGSGATQIFASPAGSNSNPGTYFFPYRDLTYTQTIVRSRNHSMTGDIDVYLESGTYRLTQPLQLTAQDSGVNGNTISWSSAPGENATISGAERITGWTLSDPSKNIWAAPVSSDLRTRQIYVNGMRATPASSAVPVALSKTTTGYRARLPVLAHWRNPSRIDFVYTGQAGLMAEPRCPVAGIAGRSITMAEPCWSNSTKRGRNLVGYGRIESPTYLENAYEALSRPGQFYLDETAHVMYYVPRAGEDMATADVEAPDLQTLISGTGGPGTPIHDLSFSNLQFSYATWLQPETPDGFSEIQANYTLAGPGAYATEGMCHIRPHGTCPFGAWTKEPGAVDFSYDRNISFLNDRFLHLGAAALNLDDGSQGDTVQGSVFTDISGNGMEIGGVGLPRATSSSQTRDITVEDNHLYGLPVEYHGGVAILVGYAAGCMIDHNQIDHVSYVAVSMGWGGWPDKDSLPPVANYSRNNVVADNLIFDYMETMADGGAIYTQGITGTSMANGEKVTGNVIHDQLDWGYALHSDDGATYVAYSRNVLYDNGYDFGSNHPDFRPGRRGKDDPVAIADNFWQQGYPNTSNKHEQIVARGNRIITGAAEAPSAITAVAGIEPGFRYVVSWQPPGESVPEAPDQARVLYTLDRKVYLTWHPSVNEGNTPVTSYTVTSCQVSGPGPCTGPGGPPATVSSSAFESLGYATVGGLTNGKGYAFWVTANSASGSSTPSIATGPATPSKKGRHIATRPRGLAVQAGHGVARLLWYAPANEYHDPALMYRVTISNGDQVVASGLRDMLSGSAGGRLLRVLGGLSSGQRYRFSIAAVTPDGVGPAARSSWVTAG
jgi:hypothetical protein